MPLLSHSISSWCPAVGALLVTSLAVAGDAIVTYDAATGLLPTEVCWDAVNPGAAPPPSFVKGALLLGPTTTSGAPYFRRVLTPFSFDDGSSVTVSVKVLASSWYAQFPLQRTGYFVALSDLQGRYAYLGIASDRILLMNTDQSWSNQTAEFDSTSGFHTYRMSFAGNVVSISVDGNVLLSDVVGTGADANTVSWGDLSILGDSTTLTASVIVEGVPTCVIADLDCNGAVDASDLAVLLGAWGTANCAADLDGNGVVNASDLAILLGLWSA